MALQSQALAGGRSTHLRTLARNEYQHEQLLVARRLITKAQDLQQRDKLPIYLPDKVEKVKWVQPIKQHGKANGP
jgi:hypothetical protein